MDRSNDHWRVPKSLAKLLRTDPERLRAWLLAVGVLFRLMQEHGGESLDLERVDHPPALMRHYFTMPASAYILGRHSSSQHLESLNDSALADVYSAFDSIVERSHSKKVIPAHLGAHINRVVMRWPSVRRELSPIAAEWDGANAPDEYFELLPDDLAT